MFPYIAIIFIPIIALCLEWFKEIKNPHKHFIMLFLALVHILFAGLRWNCGTDWEQFHDLFYSFRDVPFTGVFNHRYDWVSGSNTSGKIYEPGYALMNWLFFNITGYFNVMLIFYTTIIVFMYYKLSWLYAPKYPIYLFTFFITAEIFYWRAGFAAVICFFSIQYIISRKFWKFLLCCIIATSMHNSAILFLPFYFVLNRKISNIVLICTYLLCSCIGNTTILYTVLESVGGMFLGSEFGLAVKFISYMDTNREASVVKFILSFFKYGIFIVIFCVYRKYFKTTSMYSKKITSYYKLNVCDLYNVMLNAYVIASCIWMLFRSQMQIFVRFAIYFGDSFCILNVMLLCILPKNKRRLFFCFVVLNIIYIAFAKFGGIYFEAYFPYQTIIDK